MFPWVWQTASGVSVLMLPESQRPYETMPGLIVLIIIPALISLIGFIGSLRVYKNHTLAGLLMIISGVLMLLINIQFFSALKSIVYAAAWVMPFAPLFLIAAGVFALTAEKAKSSDDKPSDTP